MQPEDKKRDKITSAGSTLTTNRCILHQKSNLHINIEPATAGYITDFLPFLVSPRFNNKTPLTDNPNDQSNPGIGNLRRYPNCRPVQNIWMPE